MRESRLPLKTLALMLLGALIVLAAVEATTARQVVVPRPEDTRFQLVASEPIAAADGRSHLPGWSVLVFKDRKGDRCYLVLKREDSIAVEPGAPCPQ